MCVSFYNQIAIVVLLAIACANAKPAFVAPVAYSSPFVAPAALPYVTATSSQVVRVKLFGQNNG